MLGDLGEIRICRDQARKAERADRRQSACILLTDELDKRASGGMVLLEDEVACEQDEVPEFRGQVLAVVLAKVAHDLPDDAVRHDSLESARRQQIEDPV